MTDSSDLVGKVITVNGLVDGQNLGVTLPHEHIMLDMSLFHPIKPSDPDYLISNQELTLANLHRVTYGKFFDILDNTRLNDESYAITELNMFRDAGGGTICELTCGKQGENPLALKRISRATGVNIVLGCGYYVGKMHPPHVSQMTEDQIFEQFVREIKIGFGDTGVQAGVIGEIGCSWPLQADEKKVLFAAVRAQCETGVGLTIHPSPNEQSPAEILRVLKDAGGRLERTVIGHMDRCGYELETRLELLEAGCLIAYDTFGYHVHPIGAALRQGALPTMLNDVARIKQIVELADHGFLSQLLVSHDTAFKHQLTRWGGQGYGHLLANVIPYMNLYGLDEKSVHQVMVKNPRRFLEIE